MGMIPAERSNIDQYLFIGYSCLLVVTGLINIITGFSSGCIYASFELFVTSNLLTMSQILVITGCLILVATLLCYCAAYKKNIWLHVFISYLLGITLTLEITGSISGYLFNRFTDEIVHRKMNSSMEYYNSTNTEIAELWDQIQRDNKCCGTDHVSNWLDMFHGIPVSCCPVYSGTTNSTTCDESKVYSTGCAIPVASIIKEQTIMTTKMGILSAVLQFTGLSCAFFAHYLLQLQEERNRDKNKLINKEKCDVFSI